MMKMGEDFPQYPQRQRTKFILYVLLDSCVRKNDKNFLKGGEKDLCRIMEL